MEIEMSITNNSSALTDALSAASGAVISPPDQDGWFDAVPGERLRVRVPSKAAGGRYTIVDGIMQPGTGVPLHYHREDEIFEVHEGAATFQVGADRMEAGPGTIIVIPAGVHHAWANFSGSPLRMMAIFVPGGMDAFFEQLAGLPRDQIDQLAASYGMMVVGPPLGA
jgi:mannose-6-phosphate isomerase-like protein (cupin superfamily)